MKEAIYTIPMIDAFRAEDECPFCYIERNLEQHAISFVLGSSYMEDDFRAKTDQAGFCRHHYKMMYDYGNRLGSALILSTHFHKLNEELEQQIKKFSTKNNATGTSLFQRLKKSSPSSPAKTSIGSWVEEREHSCYVCDHIAENYPRYLDTFFELYKKNPEFVTLFKNSRGFCLPHFRDLIEASTNHLNEAQKKEFYPLIFSLMRENMKRLEEEVVWFTEKFDYRNKDKDWKNSKDSVQRCMQKAAGGHPADSVFMEDR